MPKARQAGSHEGLVAEEWTSVHCIGVSRLVVGQGGLLTAVHRGQGEPLHTEQRGRSQLPYMGRGDGTLVTG